MSTALITGASAGLGRALALALAREGWQLVIDARREPRLHAAARELLSAGAPTVRAIAGDVVDGRHRAALVDAVRASGLELLVNNASTLGPTPLRPLAQQSASDFEAVLHTNTVAPLALMNELLPELTRTAATIVNITSDAGAAHYPTWGSYGAAKAALEHVSATFAAEQPHLRVYAIDPGDLRTEMQQAAFPGEDISDRPTPESAVGPILELLARRPESGRYGPFATTATTAGAR